MYTLKTLMQTNGHTWIDVLKIDIEGAEFESVARFIDDFVKDGEGEGVVPVGQVQLEVHAREWSGYGEFAPFNAWWAKLEKAGLRPFWTEANLVYVNIFRNVRPDLVEVRYIFFGLWTYWADGLVVFCSIRS